MGFALTRKTEENMSLAANNSKRKNYRSIKVNLFVVIINKKMPINSSNLKKQTFVKNWSK